MANATKALATDAAARKLLRAAERLPQLENPWYTRPNLLDNWYFGNPVNQRGEAEYDAKGYTIDRWQLNIANGAAITATLGSVGMALGKSGTAAGNFGQVQENPKRFVGKTMTASILVDSLSYENSAPVLCCISGSPVVLVKGVEITGPGLYSVTFSGPEAFEKLSINIGAVTVAGNADSVFTMSIRAAKLELGDTQTLAHQDEDGNWVLNEIPDYADQLSQCQRYFQIFRTSSLRPTAGINCRPAMRTASPTTGQIDIDGTTYYTLSSEL